MDAVKLNQNDVDSKQSSVEDEDKNKNEIDQQKTTFEELKESNETTTAFEFDDEDCEYMIVTSDKNLKFPKEFLRYVCDDLSSIPKEIDLSEVPGDVVTTIFALYLPRTNNNRGEIKVKKPMEPAIIFIK